MSARAASLLRRVARVAAAPTRCVRHGSSTPAAHDAAHPQSAGAAAYEAQTPHLFGEAPVRAPGAHLGAPLGCMRWQGCWGCHAQPPTCLPPLPPRALTPLPPRPTCLCPRAPPPQAADGARVREAWEIPFYFTVAGVGAVLLAFFFRPSTNPHDWARDEAEERFRRCVGGQARPWAGGGALPPHCPHALTMPSGWLQAVLSPLCCQPLSHFGCTCFTPHPCTHTHAPTPTPHHSPFAGRRRACPWCAA